MPPSLITILPQPISSITIADNGRTATVGDHDGNVNILDLSSKEPIVHRLHTHDTDMWGLGPTHIAASPTNTRVASIGSGPNLVLLDTATLTKVFEVQHNHPEARLVTFSNDGRVIATSGTDSRIKLWNSINGSMIFEIISNYPEISSMTFSPDNQYLATGHTDGSVRIWDIVYRPGFVDIAPSHGEWRRVAISHNGEFIASTTTYGHIDLISAITGDILSSEQVDAPQETRLIAVSDAGHVVASSGGTIVRSWESGLLSSEPELFHSSHGAVRSLDITPDGEILVVASEGELFAAKRESLRYQRYGVETCAGNSNFTEVSISNDGQMVFAATSGPIACLWALSGHSFELLATTAYDKVTASSFFQRRNASGSRIQ